MSSNGDPLLAFDNTYARDLEGLYVPAKADRVPGPRVLAWNQALARELSLDEIDSEVTAATFSGNRMPEGANPLAQAYAGHQFGGFVPQLGDGRALLLGEVIDHHGRRRDIQLKGSGPTPFSRGGDGKAPLGAVLREHLIGESMHALGIPTTRALASVATGETIHRETPEPGAVLTRVAASHIRVGTFQFFAARDDLEKVRRLADYSIARHHPALAEADDPHRALLAAVVDAQAALIARWMLVGFVHGVMNTDNTTISGETIDYGPCAFLDTYHPETVFSSIDRHGRYAYGNQPAIARWNLARLAEALLPLLDDDEARAIEIATETVTGFDERYSERWLDGMRTKLGLATSEDGDLELAIGLLDLMERQKVDHTSAFRRLADAARGHDDASRALFDDSAAWDGWADTWRARCAREDGSGEDDTAEARAESMNRVNPIYIPRNHKVEEALAAAVEDQDLGPFETLLAVVECPYDERDGLDAFAEPAPPSFGRYRTFCGT